MTRWSKLFIAFISVPLAAGLLQGCHSSFIQATVTNTSAKPVRLFEVDYPSASFGSQDLAPGAAFHYRFKVLGSGPAKLTWTDGSEKEHNATGPMLQEGDEGTLAIQIRSDSAAWDVHLRASR